MAKPTTHLVRDVHMVRHAAARNLDYHAAHDKRQPIFIGKGWRNLEPWRKRNDRQQHEDPLTRAGKEDSDEKDRNSNHFVALCFGRRRRQQQDPLAADCHRAVARFRLKRGAKAADNIGTYAP